MGAPTINKAQSNQRRRDSHRHHFKTVEKRVTKEMNLKEYFKEEPTGAIAEMAKYLEVSATWLSLIIHGHRKPSPKLAVAIEKATQGLVLRNELRPDLFLE